MTTLFKEKKTEAQKFNDHTQWHLDTAGLKQGPSPGLPGEGLSLI